MSNFKFSILPIKEQKALFGGFGGTDTYNLGYLDTVYIGFDEGGSNGGNDSGGGWDSGGWDNYPGGGSSGGPGGSYGGGSGGNTQDSDGDSQISGELAIEVAEGDATTNELREFNDKVSDAVGHIGLTAANFASDVYSSTSALMNELGFNTFKGIKTLKVAGKTLGVAGVVVGGVEMYFGIQDAVDGTDSWDSADTLNALSTALGVATLVPGPHQVVTGGLSLALGLVSAAQDYNSGDNDNEYDYDYYY